MLTAHLPSGYVMARLSPQRIPYLLPAALLGAMLPDIDMIWFLFVDHGAVHHHRYWVHIPAFWLLVAIFVLPVMTKLHRLPTGLVFFAAIALHLVLDTIAGGIMWGAPFSDHLFALTTVPSSHGNWIVSFMLHWTFALELAVWIAAVFLWVRRERV